MTLTAPWRFDSRSPSAPRIIGMWPKRGERRTERIEDVDLPRRVVGRDRSPRMTWVMFMSQSSTTHSEIVSGHAVTAHDDQVDRVRGC